MQIQVISHEVSSKPDLINYLRHNTVLFGNPNIQPYLDAEISVRTVSLNDILPTQTYLYKAQLNVMRELDEQFNDLGFNFAKQNGFITYETKDGKFTMYPPLVEVVNGRPLLIDGSHRSIYATRKNGDGRITVVFIKNALKDAPSPVFEVPGGWNGIVEFDDFGDIPPSFVKRYKRYDTDEAYKYFFHRYQFPGQTKRKRVGANVNLDVAVERTEETSSVRYESERKWVLPKYVLTQSHSYLIRFEPIAQGYIPTGRNLSLKENSLSVSSKLSLDLSPGDALGIRDGVLDMAGNFPDDAEFRYRLRDGRRLATIKGPSASDGRDRPQVEFDVSQKDFDALCTLAPNEIRKTRAIIPDGKGIIEIDFYERPELSFISIEREFDAEDPNTYALPNWLARLNPIDVTSDKAFKNKNLTKTLADGSLAANAKFAEIMRCGR